MDDIIKVIGWTCALTTATVFAYCVYVTYHDLKRNFTKKDDQYPEGHDERE